MAYDHKQFIDGLKQKWASQDTYKEVIKPVSLFRKLYNCYKLFKLFLNDKFAQHYINEILADKDYIEGLFFQANIDVNLQKFYKLLVRYKIEKRGKNCVPPTYSDDAEGIKVECSTEENLLPEDIAAVNNAVRDIQNPKEQELMDETLIGIQDACIMFYITEQDMQAYIARGDVMAYRSAGIIKVKYGEVRALKGPVYPPKLEPQYIKEGSIPNAGRKHKLTNDKGSI